MLKYLWLSLLIIVLDLWSKSIASEYLLMHQPVPVFPGLNMTLMHNYGAAFSFLSNAGGWQRWFFTILALAVSAFIIGWLRKLEKQQTFLAIALALVLGGALANVWDRITLGYVVDFIDVYYQQWHWPAFNIADSAICVGAVMLIIDALFFQHHTEKK